MFWDPSRLWNKNVLGPRTGDRPIVKSETLNDDFASVTADHCGFDVVQMQKMAMVGMLSAGAMHDINNFISVVIGSLELYEEDFKTETSNAVPNIKHVSDAKYAARYAAKILSSFMAFSRNGNTFAETIEPENLLSEIELLGLKGAHPTLTYTFDLASHTSIFIDRNMLVASLLNLLINARQAVNERGKIHITYRDATRFEARSINSAHAIAISVQDDGDGLSPENSERIATPFFTTKAKGQGTGLGLTIVKSFAKQSNGNFSLKNGDKGAIATLILPIKPNSEID